MTPFNSELPDRVARPFDLWRTTGVVSEGATMVVIEAEDSPRPGYSYVSGYGFAHDAPDDLCGGMAVAARQAMAAARIRPNQIEVINAWGPGHRLIDQAEYQALKLVFPSILSEIPTVSIKGSVGSPLGAAPAIQVATAALGQRYGLVVPTVNWDKTDPACPLNLSNRMRAIEHQVTLVNSHGIGGVNAAMVLERC
jgi:3-oxoacyl-(acyl-carrier-protein) synthase